MSTSGSNTGARRAYTARHMMEESLRRAGIPPSKFTSEIGEIVLDQFNLMLNEMLNLGMQLWGRDRVILPLYQNVNQVPTPLGTSVVITVNQRYLTRPPVIAPFSDQGGTPAFAFDDNFATACVQTAPNGSIGALFPNLTQITTVGILFDAPGQFGIFYEYTLDGTNWIAADAADYTATGGDWLWRDIEGTPVALGWRIRSVGTDNLAVDELYFGNCPTEIPMGVWNLDDWNAMVVKDSPGVPWNWYQQRDLDIPVLFVWPRPNDQAKYYQLIVWRRRYLQDVTSFNQTLDVSRRWLEGMTASLARRCCLSIPEADMTRYPTLLQAEGTSMSLAIGEERDPAPIRYNPGISVYRA